MATPAARINGTSQKAAAEKIATTRATRSQDSRSVTTHNGHRAPNQNATINKCASSRGASSARRPLVEVWPVSVNDAATSTAPDTPARVNPRAESRFNTAVTGEATDEAKKRLAVTRAGTARIAATMSNRPSARTVNAPPSDEVH